MHKQRERDDAAVLGKGQGFCCFKRVKPLKLTVVQMTKYSGEEEKIRIDISENKQPETNKCEKEGGEKKKIVFA